LDAARIGGQHDTASIVIARPETQRATNTNSRFRAIVPKEQKWALNGHFDPLTLSRDFPSGSPGRRSFIPAAMAWPLRCRPRQITQEPLDKDDRTMAQSFTTNALLIDDATDFGAVENLSKKVIRDGEEALILAMLEMAVEDFQKYLFAADAQGKALFQEAEEWILTSDSRWFFSFDNVCRHLNMSPSYIRRGLMHWKDTRLRAQAERSAKEPEPISIGELIVGAMAEAKDPTE
jgi:hypothetical protein